jgi:hypothetical protein
MTGGFCVRRQERKRGPRYVVRLSKRAQKSGTTHREFARVKVEVELKQPRCTSKRNLQQSRRALVRKQDATSCPVRSTAHNMGSISGGMRISVPALCILLREPSRTGTKCQAGKVSVALFGYCSVRVVRKQAHSCNNKASGAPRCSAKLIALICHGLCLGLGTSQA